MTWKRVSSRAWRSELPGGSCEVAHAPDGSACEAACVGPGTCLGGDDSALSERQQSGMRAFVANAASVGAKTVNGPLPLRAPTRPPAWSAVARVFSTRSWKGLPG